MLVNLLHNAVKFSAAGDTVSVGARNVGDEVVLSVEDRGVGIPAADVQLDKSFTDDLDVDSLSMVEVVVAAEEKFDVRIPDDEVKNLKTVGDAVSYIENAQAA